MFSRIVTSALVAGAGAGLAAGLLHLVFVQPLLLHAELYESGRLVHFGAEAVTAHPQLPGPGVMRGGLTVIFDILIHVGYALVLVAAMALGAGQGARIDARRGLIWGLAGFVAVQMAPAASLPPEVPGVAAADLAARQIWWFGTVIAAAVALWLIAFARSRASLLAAAVLLLAPHLIGAPEPDYFAGPVPPELASLFAARALATGMAAWAILGALAGWLWAARAEGGDARRA